MFLSPIFFLHVDETKICKYTTNEQHLLFISTSCLLNLMFHSSQPLPTLYTGQKDSVDSAMNKSISRWIKFR